MLVIITFFLNIGVYFVGNDFYLVTFILLPILLIKKNLKQFSIYKIDDLKLYPPALSYTKIYILSFLVSALFYFFDATRYVFLQDGIYSYISGDACIFPGKKYQLFVISKLTVQNLFIASIISLPFYRENLSMQFKHSPYYIRHMSGGLLGYIMHMILVFGTLALFYEGFICYVSHPEFLETNTDARSIFYGGGLYGYFHIIFFGWLISCYINGPIYMTFLRVIMRREYNEGIPQDTHW